MKVNPNHVNKLLRLTAQLYSLAEVSSDDDFLDFGKDVASNYLGLTAEISKEVRDTVLDMDEDAEKLQA